MSDVQDIIAVGELLFRITKGLVSSIMKVMSTAYYAQWKGQASLQKLHDLCGSNISYIEVATQDAEVLKKVSSRIFDKYNILYSPLPDLNTADGLSQYAFNTEQAESMKAAFANYNAERLEKLKTAKEKYGVGTEKFIQAKKEIEMEFPSIRSLTAEDYVMTRLDEHGNETPEYKALEENAKENIKKVEEKMEDVSSLEATPQTLKESTEEKVIRFKDAKKKLDYNELLSQGLATQLSVADKKVEYIADGDKQNAYYRLPIDDKNQVVLTKHAKVNESLFIDHQKQYPIVNAFSNKITKLPGKEIVERIKEYSKKAKTLTALVNQKELVNPVNILEKVKGKSR